MSDTRQERCADCNEAAKHAYSDATTPGFFSPKCSKHRDASPEPAPAPIPEWMILPENSAYPQFEGVHPKDDWCAKAGCRPACRCEDNNQHGERCKLIKGHKADHHFAQTEPAAPPVPAEPHSAHDWRVLQGIPDTRRYSGKEIDKLLDAFNKSIRDQFAAAERRVQEWVKAEHDLGESYLRLRGILDAFDTPFAPTDEQIWEHTEQKANEMKTALLSAQTQLDELKAKTATLIEGLPTYSKSASMYQRVEAVKALIGRTDVKSEI